MVSGQIVIVSMPNVESVLLSDGRTIRLVGVAPSERFPQSEVARIATDILRGFVVRIEPYERGGKDPAGRTLGYVFFRDGTMLNALLLKSGLAVHFAKYPSKYAARLSTAERLAIAAKIGVWGNDAMSVDPKPTQQTFPQFAVPLVSVTVDRTQPTVLRTVQAVVTARNNTARKVEIWVSVQALLRGGGVRKSPVPVRFILMPHGRDTQKIDVMAESSESYGARFTATWSPLPF
jgi:endonuclease YncB( thermonuclease family)